ncbi:autophagy-related protein 22-like protein [Suillus discolor]|uniref:Autophagy-related protein n=1 Tax=Suillus discolor TaxID=1912936 RepID=A0A9P7JY97_9AGAM|nr:autophagy-related protein 22-like protein [Suillus discolor]KAG2115812.1 autophagy-related protein 22-like protein [Suillus discolor]
MSTSPPSLPSALHNEVVQAEDIQSEESSDKDSNQIAILSISNDEPLVTRRELWSYYLYCNGDNGVGPLGYTQTLFQGLATAAGYDPVAGPGSSCLATTASGQCVVPWGGGTKSVSSVVLIANGISFAIMTAIFTTIGSAADYGTFGRWLLFAVTVVCWAAQYACMALTTPNRWVLAMVLYILGFVSYGATLVFFSALFPRLARNTPHARQLREKYENGEISPEVYEQEESLEKNRISNISTAHSNVGYVVTLLLNLTLLLPMTNNPKVDNYVLVLVTTYWVVLGIWWFILQEPRPGPNLPAGEHYTTIGWKQIWAALKTYKHLPYTFVYLFSFFLLADGLNTTGTLVSICQNNKFSFSFLQNTYLGLSQAITSTISTLAFWYIQRYWKISTKKMFVVTNVVTILIPLWGMIGIWTEKLGFHNVWEFWAYNIVFGLFQAPYYAFSQTMMAELSPPGFDNMFFGLFGLSNRASSMVGPNVIQAIIEKTGNNWQGFPFLFALCTAASLVIWFGVDVTKGRRDAVKWAAEQRSHTH